MEGQLSWLSKQVKSRSRLRTGLINELQEAEACLGTKTVYPWDISSPAEPNSCRLENRAVIV